DVNPSSLTFPSQAFGVPSSAQPVTVTNTGGIGLTISSITMGGLAILVGGLTCCSGSGGGTGGTQSGGQGNSSTPAGTYSIPVTVTSSGVVHTVTLTLIVD
ncbi:MAG: hypothetical protein ACLP00_28470, partial [Terracidiphilus sp.]